MYHLNKLNLINSSAYVYVSYIKKYKFIYIQYIKIFQRPE